MSRGIKGSKTALFGLFLTSAGFSTQAAGEGRKPIRQAGLRPLEPIPASGPELEPGIAGFGDLALPHSMWRFPALQREMLAVADSLGNALGNEIPAKS
jgi:hypothetical protein